MMFSNKPTSKVPGQNQPKQRSVLGMLFVPDMGGSIKPLGETTRVFINLIAMIFAMNGLFPKNHPALLNEPGARLSLSEILRTGYRGLYFTKEGLPKVLLFFSVAGAILFSVLAMITSFMLLFVGKAHADTATCSGGTCFSLPSGSTSTDLAMNWLDYLFGNTSASSAAMANLGGPTKMPSTTVQQALQSALSLYSYAMLIFAAVLLFYQSTTMVVETAHHGVPMGKQASQIWAPIRLVVAIGLLVPVSGGLSSGQYIVIQMAKWGSALASNVWGVFATQLANNTGGLVAPTATPDVSGIVSDLEMMYACEYAYNYEVGSVSGTGLLVNQQHINGWTFTKGGTPGDPPATPFAIGSQTYSFSNTLISDYALCGSYTIPAAPQYPSGQISSVIQPVAQSFYDAAKSAFNGSGGVTGAAALAAVKMQYVIDRDGPLPSSDDWGTIASTYQSALQSALTAAMAGSGTNMATMLQTLKTQSTQSGWISAGAWFNQLSSAQAEVNGIVANSLPSTSPPKLVAGDAGATEGFQNHWYNFMFRESRSKQADIYATTTGRLSEFAKLIGYSNANASTINTTNATMQGSNCGLAHPTECVIGLVSEIAAHEGIWQPATNQGVSLGIQFSGSADPLAEIAAFGHANVSAAMNMFDDALYLYGALALGKAGLFIAGVLGAPLTGGVSALLATIVAILGKAATLLAGPLFFLGVLFLTMGVAMGFIVPLLPFMHFFFNTITWVACVAEAIIAIPLVALAHITPAGDGLPSQGAKGAYGMIFSILLRPVMMVFGLICGLLIMYVAVGLLNNLYSIAVASQGDNVSGHMMFSRIMYSIIYVALVFSIANHSFGLISSFPNKAMGWMGATGMHGEKMGDPGHIAGATQLATTYFGNNAANQLKDAVGNVSRLSAEATAKAEKKDNERLAGEKATDANLKDHGYTRVNPDGSRVSGDQEGAFQFMSPKGRELGYITDLPGSEAGKQRESRARTAGRNGEVMPNDLAGDEHAVRAYHQEYAAYQAQQKMGGGDSSSKPKASSEPDSGGILKQLEEEGGRQA